MGPSPQIDIGTLIALMRQRRMQELAAQQSLPMRLIPPLGQWQPMWAEDQMRGLKPGFTDGYDYWNALKYGIRRDPGAFGHLSSRVPQTGLLLKSEEHPSFWKTLRGEAEAGYEIYRGADGRLYSRPRAK